MYQDEGGFEHGSPYIIVHFGRTKVKEKQYRVCPKCRLYCWCGSELVGKFVSDHSRCQLALFGPTGSMRAKVEGTVLKGAPVEEALSYRPAYGPLEELGIVGRGDE
jgi:hypothetical protein